MDQDRWLATLRESERLLRARKLTTPLARFAWFAFMLTLIKRSPLVDRGQLPRAVWRFIAWQAWRSLLRDRPVRVSFTTDNDLEFPAWSQMGSLCVSAGSTEPTQTMFVTALLKAGDVVIDVGANIGYYSTLAKAAGAAVFAFEPSTRARTYLERNLALNPGGNVTVFPVALSDQRTKMALTTGLDVANHLVEQPSFSGTEQVDVYPLDSLCSGPGASVPSPVALIKIDAEGFDAQVIRGAGQTIMRDRPVLIVETWGHGEVQSQLSEMGYRTYRYSPDDRSLIEYPEHWDYQANLLAVHRSRFDWVQHRIQSTPSLTIQAPTVHWRESLKAKA